MKGKERSVPWSIFFWWEDLALSFNDGLNRWKVNSEPNEQRDSRLPLWGSQGGNEAAEKQLSSGRRQPGQTARLSRSSLADSKQAAAVDGSQQGSQLQSLVCTGSQAQGSCSVFPPSRQHWGCKLASPRILPRVWQLALGQDVSPHASFPPAKAACHTPPSLCKVSLGAGLQALERGCPGKPRIFSLVLVSGGSIFHTFFRISNRPVQQRKMQPSLTWLALIGGDPA